MKNKLTILMLVFLLLGTFGCKEKELPFKIETADNETIGDPIKIETALASINKIKGEYSKAQDKYEFPDISWMTDWEQYPNLIQERLKALQVHENVLETISTKGLLETCLEYPYLLNIFVLNDYQTGFNSLVRQFNGYSELLQRPDLITVLIEKYAVIGDEVPEIQSRKGLFSYRHFVLEFILTQDVVVENLNEEQVKTLVLLSFENKELKNNNPDIFSGLNYVPTYLLYAKIVINDPDFEFESAEQKDIVSGFIQAPHGFDQQTAEYIENYIYEKYKQ